MLYNPMQKLIYADSGHFFPYKVHKDIVKGYELNILTDIVLINYYKNGPCLT